MFGSHYANIKEAHRSANLVSDLHPFSALQPDQIHIAVYPTCFKTKVVDEVIQHSAEKRYLLVNAWDSFCNRRKVARRSPMYSHVCSTLPKAFYLF